MWWIKTQGRTMGPFETDDLKRRIALGQFGRYDRVSSDRAKWVFVKDTELWQATAAPAPKEGRVAHVDISIVRPQVTPVKSAEPETVPPLLPPQFSLPKTECPTPMGGRWMRVAVAVCVCLILGGFWFMTMWSLREDEDAGEVGSGAAARVEAKRADSAAKPKDIRFVDVKDKVLVIGNEGKGGGSAFLLKEQGKVWLVTNEHVTRGSETEFRNVMCNDGRLLTLGRFQIAEDGRDLVRFEVSGDLAAFTLAEGVPDVGDRILIYGNSLGGGAITELKGYVKSVGPFNLEVDAEGVSGNSGSAVLNARGEVLGVFSFARNETVAADDKENWVQKGTQFDAVRRFAIRFTNVKWRDVSWKTYLWQSAKAKDLRSYLLRIGPLLFADYTTFEPDDYAYGKRLVYENVTGEIFGVCQDLESQLVNLSAAYRRWKKARDTLKATPENMEAERLGCYRQFLQRDLDYCEEKSRALVLARDRIAEETWFPQIRETLVIKWGGSVDAYLRIVKALLATVEHDVKAIRADLAKLDE